MVRRVAGSARRVRVGCTIGVVTAALTLGACSTPRSSRSPSPTVSAVPSSAYVTPPSDRPQRTTAPGSSLRLGDPAQVWWKPTAHQVALLTLRVTAIHRTTFKQSFKGWRVTGQTARTTPYFVTAKASSSKPFVSGRQVPLYALDSKEQLVQASSFKQAFGPCSPSTFPLHTRPHHAAAVCLVYLLPPKTSLTGVVYRPDQSLAPITWKGALTPLAGSSRK